ncbi:MAG: HAMP domain-containing histidine kinase [Clostridia bacterium]|nr:HAMP domain-containing histidine kinase [Clostridia bacterium]
MRLDTEQKENIKRTQTLRWRLTLFVFAIIAIACGITGAVLVLSYLLFRRNPVVAAIMVNPFSLTITLLITCALIAALLTSFLGRYYLRPLKNLIAATKEVRKGNFKVQVDTKGPTTSEMGQLNNSFNDMVHELDSIELFRNDFINNFSHEFKTPIISIRGFAKELQQGNLSPEQQEYAKIIAEEADRLAKLSINVLELSKLENQQILTDKTEFYLDEQLRQCILLQEGEWTRKNIEIVPELEEVLFYSNEEILSHVWMNLIQNAIKFTPENGTVRIALTAIEKAVTVRISDTGIGMSEEMCAHIFEKFYQGDTSHHRSGYGIGLTMAHRAATLCGGRIAVESKLGQGSTFTVVLPR